MSNRYKGAVISATPPTTTGGESGTASGAWTLEQQMQLIAAGLWPLQPTFKYIEDVFSTYLYTGTGASQTVTNGIDLSTKGGLVWTKCRSNETNNALFDTARGTTKYLSSNLTNAQATEANGITAFGTTGYTFGNNYDLNESTFTYASWTFREQPKFFDIVTYTGNGTVGRTVSHNLGSTPGCIIVKCTSAGSTAWVVYHRSVGATAFLRLNTTGASTTSNAPWNDTNPTSTQFTVDGVGGDGGTNASGATYVAYLFAHDAGGFGLTGTDNVISCGSFTASGGLNVNLGWEPQFILFKRTDSTIGGDWHLYDNMRGFGADGVDHALLYANLTNAESLASRRLIVTATGFQVTTNLFSGSPYIYIAIRRGPMKVPETGTSVFAPVAQTLATGSVVTTGFVTDMGISRPLSSSTGGIVESRLTAARFMQSSSNSAESAGSSSWGYMNGYGPTPWTGSGLSSIAWAFRRAPSFMDVCCYTGTGSARTVAHNLAAVPELMIVKNRTTSGYDWDVYYGDTSRLLLLNTNSARINFTGYWVTAPTASVFSVNVWDSVNASGSTYVAYLFTTCPGVSKVGSYTGNGSSQTINCGFTGGARFVLIKRTDSTGDWYVWDSARGIVAGNDPHLSLNTTAAEVTTDDSVDTDSTGFVVNQVAATNINVSSATYVFLAVA